MEHIIKQVFNEIHTQVFGFEYVYFSERSEKCLTNFVKIMPSGANELWLRNYIVFQLHHYSKSGRIYLNWVFGPKALQRWASRTDSAIYYTEKWKVENNIVRNFKRLDASEYREQERQRFDDNRKLFHCLELALFVEDECSGCEFFNVCKSDSLNVED